MKFLLVLVTLFSVSLTGYSQDKPKKQEVVIQTNAQCGDCKERIENKLNYTKGVIFAEMDLETKKVTVKFKTSKISLDEVKQTIAEIGYNADDVKAVEKAQKALPMCCQPGGH